MSKSDSRVVWRDAHDDEQVHFGMQYKEGGVAHYFSMEVCDAAEFFGTGPGFTARVGVTPEPIMVWLAVQEQT